MKRLESRLKELEKTAPPATSPTREMTPEQRERLMPMERKGSGGNGNGLVRTNSSSVRSVFLLSSKSNIT